MANLKLTRGRIFRVEGREEYFMFLKTRSSQYADALQMIYDEEEKRFKVGKIEEKIPRKLCYIPTSLPGEEENFKELYKLK